MTITKKIQLKRATLAQWTDFNPILDAGEVGVDLTNHKLKVGDGVTAFNSLPYVEGEIDLSNYYTKAQVDALIAEIDLTDYYTKTETDTLLSGKVNVSDLSNYYTKSQTYSQAETDSLLAGKVDDTDLATVATTGDYDDLLNKPVIPDVSNLATKTELADGLAGKEDAFEIDAPIALNNVKHSTNLNVTNGSVSQISEPAGDKGRFVQSCAISRTNYLSSLSDYRTPSIENLTDFFAGGYVDIPLPATGSYSFMTGCRTRYINFVLGKGYDNNFIPIAALSPSYDNNGGLYLNMSDIYSLTNTTYGKYLQLSDNPVIAQNNYSLDGGGGVSGLDLAVSIDKSNSSQYRIDYNFTTDGTAWYSKHSLVTNASHISRLDEVTTLRLFINDIPAPSFTAERIGVYNYAGTFYAKSLEDLGTNLIDIEKLINGSEHLQLNIGAGLAVQNGSLVNTNPTPATVDQTYDATSTNAQSGTAVAGAIADKVNGDGITDVVALTQAAYDALVTKDLNTLYVITDASAINDELYYKAGDTFTPSSVIYVAGDSYNNKTSFVVTLTLPKRLTNITNISWVVDSTYVYQESSRYPISSSDTNLRFELFKASDIHLNIRITTIDGTEMLPSGRANVILGVRGTFTFS